MDTIKTYTRRDSATAILRKMGVDKTEYNYFIEVVDIVAGNHVVGTEYHVNVTAAEAHVKQAESDLRGLINHLEAQPAEAQPAEAQPAEAQPAEAQPAEAQPAEAQPAETVSTVARRLILDLYTNKEVWAILKEKFNLDDSKKHYPSWYRSELKRKGLLT